MIYDYNTSNKSFINVSNELAKRGVKNHKFMLALYDESLVGVDPYSPNLTLEQKARIFAECSRNLWYFLREVVRIPVAGKSIPYSLNLGNLALTYIKHLNLNSITLLPRQTGKTIGAIVHDLYLFYFVSTNTKFTYANKSFTDSKDNLKRFKDIRDELPDYIKQLIMHEKDKDNKESKYSHIRNNELVAKPSPNSFSDAEKIGRGMSTPIVLMDEIAFLKYNKEVYSSLAPAWLRSAIEAEKNNAPRAKTLITTPNNLDTPEGAWCMGEIIEPAVKFKEEFYDYDPNYLKEYIRKNSSNDFVHIQYHWKELGYDDEWYETACRNLNNNLLKIKREIELEWTFSTDNSVFSEEQLSRLALYIKKPVLEMRVNNHYDIQFYEEPDFARNYIISCDVAGGLDRDNSALTIIDPGDFRVVGDFKSSGINTDDYRQLIQTLMTLYFKNALLLIEANTYGKNILDYLMKIPEIEARMFYTEPKDEATKTLKNGRVVRKSNIRKKKYGLTTTSKTRPFYFEILRTIIDDEPEKIVSPKIYDEIKTLIYDKNGRIDHMPGKNDDSLISYLLFRYAIIHEDTFTKKFGIAKVPRTSNIKSGIGSFGIEFKSNVDNILNIMNKDPRTFQQDNYFINLNTEIKNTIKTLDKKENQQFNREIEFINKILNLNFDDQNNFSK